MTATVSSPWNAPQNSEPQLAAARYTVFRRQGQLFALSISLVREVLPGQPLTRVARAAAQLLGVLNLRGEILPVVLIDPLLGLGAQPEDPQRPILVLRQADLVVGLRVDSIQRVVSVTAEQLQPHPNSGADGLLQSLWHPPGQSAITFINGATLLERLRQDATLNL